MSHWTIDEPTALDFDGVVALRATLVGGHVSVLTTEDRPSLQVSEVDGPPLRVSHEAGMLNVTHENLLWEGVLNWLRTQRCSAEVTLMVAADCPVQLNLVTADAVITGLTARTSLKSGAGNLTLDGVTGRVDANTMSGALEAQGLDGEVSFTSVSGDLALAGGAVDRLAARTVSGKIDADVVLGDGGQMQVNTVSGEVTLRLPESSSAQVDLSSTAGRIDATFPDLERRDHAVARNLSGKVGDGAGTLSVATVSGDVTLLSRPDDRTRRPGGPEMNE